MPAYARAGAELLFDPQQLVVLGDAVGAARRAGLDLAGAGADGEIGDRRVFGLARAVRDDAGVAGVARHRHGVERFGDGADLIQLDQHRVADALVDAALQDLRVGHEHVVADELHSLPSAVVSVFQPSQSPSARPSSIEMIGYWRTQSS